MPNIQKMKRHWVEISISIAFSVPLLAVLIVDDWDIYTDALSDFGTNPNTAGFWSVYLVLVSVMLWINGSEKIESSYEGRQAHLLSLMLNLSCIGLVFTGLITNSFNELHGIMAGVFFITYDIFIFFYGFWMLKRKLKEGAISVIASFLLLATSLLTIPVTGLALFEIVYITIIIYWNWTVRQKSRIDFLSNVFTSSSS